MFTYPKELISYLDSFRVEHSGTIAIITASVSLVAIVKSTLTTWSLHQQANLQRQIESNRYKLELFDRRYEFLEEFKKKINVSYIMEPEVDKPTMGKKVLILNENLYEVMKISKVFGYEKGSEIRLFADLHIKIKELIDLILEAQQKKNSASHNYLVTSQRIHNFKEKRINYEKFFLDEEESKKVKYDNDTIQFTKDFEDFKASYLNSLKDYYGFHKNCISYMESKLSVSGEPYTAKQGWFGFLWSSIVQSAPKHERYVMYFASATCLIFLVVLLCS